MKPKIIVVSAPFDETSSYLKGAAKAPQKIIDLLEHHIELYDRYTESIPAQDKEIVYKPILDMTGMSPDDMVKHVSKQMQESLGKEFTLLLGGNHSVTIGAIDALKKNGLEDVTILHIDAHLDMRDDDSDHSENPSMFGHSCVLRRGHEIGYDSISIGVRMYSPEENKYAKENKKCIVIEWPQKEDQSLIDDIIDSVKTDKIYITLDVDGIDPSFMPSTGTPVQGGLSWYFTLDLIRELFCRKNVIGADIVEVIPNEDLPMTEKGAAIIAYMMMGSTGPKCKKCIQR